MRPQLFLLFVVQGKGKRKVDAIRGEIGPSPRTFFAPTDDDKTMNRAINISMLVAILAATVTRGQDWIEVGRCPTNPRALSVTTTGAALGFAVDSHQRAVLFTTARGVPVRTVPLEESPAFSAFGRNIRGDRLCIPQRGPAPSVLCWDADLKMREKFSVPGTVVTLAQMTDREIWLSESHEPGRNPVLTEWRKSGTEWRPSGRTIELPNDQAGPIDSFEIHPIDERTIAVMTLMGTFDGSRDVYPSPWIWNIDTGPHRRISPKTISVPPEGRRIRTGFRGRPLRYAFRSAASKTYVALVPALIDDEDKPPRRDEVWIHEIAGGDWKSIHAPGSVGAVAIDENAVYAATADGRIWRRPLKYP